MVAHQVAHVVKVERRDPRVGVDLTAVAAPPLDEVLEPVGALPVALDALEAVRGVIGVSLALHLGQHGIGVVGLPRDDAQAAARERAAQLVARPVREHV